MQKRLIPTALVAGLLLSLVSLGCGDDEEEIDRSPVVGVLELAVSLRHQDPEPQNAVRVETTNDSLRVDGVEVVALERGFVPANEVRDGTIPKLADAINAAQARRVAALRLNVNTPWETTVLALGTIEHANIHTASFMVRPPGGGANTGWMTIEDFHVQEATNDPVEFERGAQRNWAEWVEGWEEAYEGCRRDHYVDCNPKPHDPAEGGLVEIRMFSRGSALKVDYTRFGIEDPEPRAQPQMLEGLAPPSPEGEFIEPPPVTSGAFSWRFEAAIEPELSPVTSAFRPLCGQRTCGVVVTGDKNTMTLRLLSFLGAAFPNGGQSPKVIFLIPTR